jgi:hypothetical protein
MKKFLLFILACVSLTKVYSQCYPAYDTIRRNELSLSVLPVLALFSGYYPSDERNVMYNFGYKHYLKNRYVLRASFGISPEYYMTGGVDAERYIRTVDTVNVFSNYSVRARQKMQLNFGFEKIYLVKRFMHGIGAELILSYQTFDYNRNAYWYPTYLSAGDPQRDELYYNNANIVKKQVYNGVDSLSYSYVTKEKSLGIRLFYSLRYKINRHFYVSSTLGPVMAFTTKNYSDQKGNSAQYYAGNGYSLDFNLLISDISLAFRF